MLNKCTMYKLNVQESMPLRLAHKSQAAVQFSTSYFLRMFTVGLDGVCNNEAHVYKRQSDVKQVLNSTITVELDVGTCHPFSDS